LPRNYALIAAKLARDLGKMCGQSSASRKAAAPDERLSKLLSKNCQEHRTIRRQLEQIYHNN
jgi:hypothetical protein